MDAGEMGKDYTKWIYLAWERLVIGSSEHRYEHAGSTNCWKIHE
jgi:hypothetical protein